MSTLSAIMIRHGSRRRYYQGQQMLGVLQPSSSLPMTSFDNDDNNKHSTTIQNRSYHATNRNEILPFVAAGVLVGAGVYTFRTLQQIDKDWEDYYHDLEEYKSVTGIDPEQQSSSADGSSAASNRSDNADLSSFFTGGTLAIDIGTSRLKLSHQPSLSKNKNAKPSVIVDREGHRSTPAIAWRKDGEDILIGRLAASRSFDTRGGSIVHPQDVLLGNNDQIDMAAIQKTLRDVAANALDQALGSSTGSSVTNNSNNPLFVLDTSIAIPGSYNVRPIITYPPAQSTATSSPTDMNEQYQQALNGFTSPEGIADYVSEPLAIVSGAEYYNLLPPTSSSNGPVLVVDVGGTKTQVSMVLGDEVLYSSSLPFGGDTYIDLLVSKLAADFFGPSVENDDDSTDLSAKPRLNDPTALQRLYDESTKAVHELSNKTRSEINIPYLTMDLETRQPKHLEVGMSRQVVNAEFESWLKSKLVPHLQREGGCSSLSQALPPPSNLSTLFSSTIMSALEQTSMTPMQLRAVLVVGGGARIPLIQSSMKESVGYLAGELDKLVIPEVEVLGELCVLGAQLVKSK